MKNIYFSIFALLLVIFANSIFIVNEQQQAIVLQFGEVMKIVQTPGLKFKIPVMHNVQYFEKRVLNLNAEEKEVIAKDQKRLIVSAFAKYKIFNPLLFYQSVRNESGAQSRLNSVLDSSLRHIIGAIPLSDLLTDKRTDIMTRIGARFNEQSKVFGIEIIDVRIMRADLPKENSNAIFSRMKADREKEAKEFRAEGNEEAQKIMALADKEKTIILAEAEKKSQILKGDGDSIASKNFATTFSQDPEFFAFYQTMDAYKASLKGENTKIIMSPEHSFFKYLKQQ